MRLNLLNKTVVLSGLLLVKASEDEARMEDDSIKQRIENNIWRISDIFDRNGSYELNVEHKKFLKRASSHLKTLIIIGDPNSPDISKDSKSRLNAIGRKDNESTSFIKDDDNTLLPISKEVNSWFKELLYTEFFNRRFSTPQNREWKSFDIFTLANIQDEAICLHILCTEYPKGVLMSLRNLILSKFQAIGAEAVMLRIDACLKTIIESLGKASKKASIYFNQSNNANWKANIEALLTPTGFEKNKPDLAQSASETLPKKSKKEAPILDEQNLETLRHDLESLYTKEIRPAIDEVLSYYYLFLYVCVNNATDNQLSNTDAPRYYDLRDCIKSLDYISLLLCGILELIRKEDISLKSHMAFDLDYKIFGEYPTTNFRFFVKELHEENGVNTLYIDLSKALKKFDDFKNHYTENLAYFEDDDSKISFLQPKASHGCSFIIIKFLAEHLLYITYNVTKDMLNKKEAISERIEQNIYKLDYFIKSSNIMHSNITIEEQKGHIKEFCNDTGMFEVDKTRNPIINITDKTKRKPTENPTDFLGNELVKNDQTLNSKLEIAESYLMEFLLEQNADYEKRQKKIAALEHGTERAELEATQCRFPIDSNNLSFLLLSSKYYPCGGLNYLFYSILKMFESIGASCNVLLNIKFCLQSIIAEMVNRSNNLDECVELCYSSVSNHLEVLKFIYNPDALSKIILYYQAYLYAELDKCSANMLDDGLMLIYRDLYYQIYTLDVISRLLLNIKFPTSFKNYKIKESTALCMFDRMVYIWKHNFSSPIREIYHSNNDLDTPISANQLLAKVDEFAEMYSSSIEKLGSTTTSHNLESDLSKDICRLSCGLMHITRGIIEQENALESEKDKMDN